MGPNGFPPFRHVSLLAERRDSTFRIKRGKSLQGYQPLAQKCERILVEWANSPGQASSTILRLRLPLFARTKHTDAMTMDGSSNPYDSTSETEAQVKGRSTTDTALPLNRLVTYLVLAIIGATADLWSKAAIFAWRGIPGTSGPWWIIDEHFGIETAVNIGAVFGLGAGKGTIFAVLSIAAAIGIFIWLFRFKAAESLWLTWALGMITGGIIGNLYDRLGMWWQPGYPEAWKSGVRDWILVRFEGVPLFDPWPNFNIADSLLVVGACMLMYQSFFPPEESTQTDNEPETTSSKA
jgi:signal peptidase II